MSTPPLPPVFDPSKMKAGPSFGGVLAPNQRALRWDDISKVESPFNNPGKNTFGFWFNYFWGEARAVDGLTHAQKVRLQEAFFTVFQDAPLFPEKPAFAGVSADVKLNVLRQILMIGFRRVALSAPLPPTKVGPPPGRIWESFQGQYVGERFKMKSAPSVIAKEAVDLNFTYTLPGAQGGKVPIGFRSDARTNKDLNGNGFQARAREAVDSDQIAMYGLNQPWHPFGNPVYKNSLFLRMGAKNKDNCLQTVVSVGTHLSEIVHFPILNDFVLIWDARSPSGQFLAVKPFDQWTPEDVRVCEDHWRKVKVIRVDPSLGTAIDHLAHQNTMHVFHLKGLKGINTKEYFGGNDAFPERGMESVPDSHMLCEIRYTQNWYFSATDNQIMLYEVIFHDISWLKGQEYYDSLFGPGGKDKLTELISKQMNIVQSNYAAEKGKKERPPIILAAVTAKLTPEDRLKITAALTEMYVGNSAARGNIPLEKQFVSQKLPNLATLINDTSKFVWEAMRPKAAKQGFAPPGGIPKF